MAAKIVQFDPRKLLGFDLKGTGMWGVRKPSGAVKVIGIVKLPA